MPLWETLVGSEMETRGGRETGTVCTHQPPPPPLPPTAALSHTHTSCIPLLSDTFPVSPPELQNQPTSTTASTATASPSDDSGCSTDAAGHSDRKNKRTEKHSAGGPEGSALPRDVRSSKALALFNAFVEVGTLKIPSNRRWCLKMRCVFGTRAQAPRPGPGVTRVT